MNFATLALLPALALSSPPPATRRVSVVLVPMDKGAEANTVKLEAYIDEALEAFPNLTVKKTDDVFGVPRDESAQAAMKRAETGFSEGKSAYESHDFDRAETSLRNTIKEFGKAAPTMKSCGDLCETIALYAATVHHRGDVDEAQIAVMDLLALAPTYELPAKHFDKDFLSFRSKVATGSAAQFRGSVNVKSRPAGARVYVDGEFQGYTPMTAQTLAVGKHLVRLEHPGFTEYGQLVDVTPEDQDVVAELQPTGQYKAFDGQLDRIAAEVVKDKPGSSIVSLGKSMSIERGIVGTVKDLGDGQSEMLIGFYDLTGSGKRLGAKKIVFQGDEYGQLKSETIRIINQLVNNAEGGGEKMVKSSDPLENKHGTEDWNAEDRGGKTTTEQKKTKKNGKDPLDGVSGTEDW